MGQLGSRSGRAMRCEESRSDGNPGAAAARGGAMRGYVLDPLLWKQWPCRSPIRLPTPPRPTEELPYLLS